MAVVEVDNIREREITSSYFGEHSLIISNVSSEEEQTHCLCGIQ